MRRLLLLLPLVLASSWLTPPAHAQSISCPSGGPGGAGGLGGITTGGAGGSARTDGFASATADGGVSGDASGGRGGSGGDAGLVVCNQNTNVTTEGPGAGAGVSPPVAPAPAPVVLGPVTTPVTVGAAEALPTTGRYTLAELGLAGVALCAGGALLFLGQPLRRRQAEIFVAEVQLHDALPDPNEVWARYGRPESPDNAAEAHARRLQRAQRRQSIIRRPAPAVATDPFPHVDAVVTMQRGRERVA